MGLLEQKRGQNLSSESRCFRFVSSMKELPSPMLSRLTLIVVVSAMSAVYSSVDALIYTHGERLTYQTVTRR